MFQWSIIKFNKHVVQVEFSEYWQQELGLHMKWLDRREITDTITDHGSGNFYLTITLSFDYLELERKKI